MRIILIIIILVFSSCGNNNSNSNSDFNESDFDRVQGLITDIQTDFTYSDKFKRTYHYTYSTENKKLLNGIEKNSDLILDINDPIIVLINKSDRKMTLIAQRGTIDRTTLTELQSDTQNKAEIK